MSSNSDEEDEEDNVEICVDDDDRGSVGFHSDVDEDADGDKGEGNSLGGTIIHFFFCFLFGSVLSCFLSPLTAS